MSVCWSVVNHAKMAEMIAKPSRVSNHMGQRNYLLDGIHIPHGNGISVDVTGIFSACHSAAF